MWREDAVSVVSLENNVLKFLHLQRRLGSGLALPRIESPYCRIAGFEALIVAFV